MLSARARASRPLADAFVDWFTVGSELFSARARASRPLADAFLDWFTVGSELLGSRMTRL
ncbi:Endo-1,4-beta-xylanase A precursor [Enhygromyxa salina]|uniref:Endo-1,4-beta-xylanase A n=1 Tax=Enhygromyxa salina TaxID=215803 RepID=A0A0C1ZM88_9BACT|nr:Endo-1,4-beta-xylanase A precursor [Enhygromyxa salina]